MKQHRIEWVNRSSSLLIVYLKHVFVCLKTDFCILENCWSLPSDGVAPSRRRNAEEKRLGPTYKKASGCALALQVSFGLCQLTDRTFCGASHPTRSIRVDITCHRFSRPLVTASGVNEVHPFSPLVETSPHWGLILLLRFCPIQRFENSAAKSKAQRVRT